MILNKSLEGFTVINPGDRKAINTSVREEARIENQTRLRTELSVTNIEK